LNPLAKKFWERFLASRTDRAELQNCRVEANFCGNREIADELLALYLCGKKTAGSGLVKDYELAGDPLPTPGNFWIILDSSETPRCLVRTVTVEIHKFSEVPAHIAEAEGEGDLSLAYWREAHRRFFTPHLKKWGITNLEEAAVITEFFEVVYKEA
jgi:uncharacterized protein YhfF